jgi:AcrR family transcriptional regulator
LVHNPLDPQEEKDRSGDLRVRRTRKLIQRALVELTVEKGFSTITVQDIADRAMVNRSTFYRHYLDKYDLLDKYMDEMYTMSTEEESLEAKLGKRREDLPSGLLSVLKQIQKDAAFFRVMLGPKGDPYLVERMRQNTGRRFLTLLTSQPVESDPKAVPLELRASYISYAGIGAIVWWLDHQQECSAEQLARWMGELSSASAGLTINEFLRRANRPRPKAPPAKSTSSDAL